MGLVFASQGKFDKALAEYRAAQSIFEHFLGTTHPHTASAHFNAALVHSELNDLKSALGEYKQAQTIWKETLGPTHPQTVMAMQAIEDIQIELKKQELQVNK
jgi:tetratricopeptide (TPR) repeat protein